MRRARKSSENGGMLKKASILPSANSSTGGRAGITNPDDVLERVESDMGRHDDGEVLFASTRTKHPDPFALQISDAADAFVPEEFNTSGMDSAQHGDQISRVDRGDVARGKTHVEIDAAECERFSDGSPDHQIHIADIGEALSPQQLLSGVLRG